MTVSRQHRLGVIALVVIAFGGVTPLAAEQPRARELTYDMTTGEWVEQPPPPPGTAEGDLHVVRVQIKEERYREALRGVGRFIDTYGDGHVLIPELMAVEAEALIGRRDFYKAHLKLQEFLSRFAGTEPTVGALRLEFVIAEAFLSGVKRKWLGMRILSGEDIAFDILDEISIDHSETRLAESAIKTKADYYFKQGDYSLAELEYARLAKEYPRSRYHQFAMRRSAEAALASYAGVEYDDAPLIEAEERYRDYRITYPGDADQEGVGLILASIAERRAEKAYSIGAYYERTEHTGSAVFQYRSVLGNWPDSVAASKAAERLELLGAAGPVDAGAEPASGG